MDNRTRVGQSISRTSHGDSGGSSNAGASNNISSFFAEDRITLVVDNTRFVVDPSVFTQFPNTMMGR
jgi:BTB/POZ domain-containing protein 10